MKTIMMIVVMLVAVVGPLYGTPQETPPPPPAEEQPEVLTRGPVHEAYAEPVNLDLQPGLIVPAQPPASIIENPPADRPVGSQYTWVSGYWAWDSDRNSYIWISGCWRATPPNMSWVSGYWAQVAQGWQWVPGFWVPVTSAGQIEYLPAPPAAVDDQPVVAIQGSDKIWVPSCWYWYDGQYIRRPGYWLAPKADWVWMPSHFAWTPRGYVFVRGYWDYTLAQRGVLFAPVYIPSHLYQRPGYAYSLGIVVDTGNLQFSLFTRPRYGHYYFGDYYDDAYISLGIYPWFQFGLHHTWYDPIYQYDRWHYTRTDPLWAQHGLDEYNRRRANRDLRPSRTYRDMETRLSRLPDVQRRDSRIAEPLSTYMSSRNSSMRFEAMKPTARDGLSRQANEVQSYREQRSRWESPAAQAQRVKVPDSPVSSPRDRSSATRQRPPSRPSDEQGTNSQDSRGNRGARGSRR